MRFHHVISVICAAAAFFLALPGVRPARCDAPGNKSVPEADPTLAQARQSAERGLAFLERDAAKWRKERQCSSCHHGTMTVWALCEAKSQGYAVNGESLADIAT